MSTESDGLGSALPQQNAGNSGQFLTTTTTNGLSVPSWASVGGGGGVTTVGAFGSTPTANAMSISGVTLTGQPADGTHPGFLTSGTQTIGGAKTFAAKLTGALGIAESAGPAFMGSVWAGIGSGVSMDGGTANDGTHPIMAYYAGGGTLYYNVPVANKFDWRINNVDMVLFQTQASGLSTIQAIVGDIETFAVGSGFILRSADGTRWRIAVANTTGALSASAA